MPDDSLILSIDGCPTHEARKCKRCKRPKSSLAFGRDRGSPDGLRRYCKQCMRMAAYTKYHEGGGKEAKAAYHAKDEVKGRRKCLDTRRREKRRANREAYLKTPRGRYVLGRCDVMRKLRRAKTDRQRARLEARIAMFDREIARLDREFVLPVEPPKPPKKPRVKTGTKSPFKGVYITRHGTYEVKVSIGTDRSCRGGTFATMEEARDAANALAWTLLGVQNYAVPRHSDGEAA